MRLAPLENIRNGRFIIKMEGFGIEAVSFRAK